MFPARNSFLESNYNFLIISTLWDVLWERNIKDLIALKFIFPDHFSELHILYSVRFVYSYHLTLLLDQDSKIHVISYFSNGITLMESSDF